MTDLAYIYLVLMNSQAADSLMQDFGEALKRTKELLSADNFYYFNSEFDKQFLK